MAKRAKRERAIMLDAIAPPAPRPPPPGAEFYSRHENGRGVVVEVYRRGKWRYTKTTEQVRERNVIRTSRELRREKAEVKFADIVSRCDVEENDDFGAPWDEHDGWEHVIISSEAFMRSFRNDDFQHGVDHYRQCRGYVARTGVVELNFDNRNCRENYEAWYTWTRLSGASKQVAREMQALQRRKYIDQIVKWREHGYTWYSVSCCMHDCQAGCGGIDDRDYAEHEVTYETACEIEMQLEEKGYYVTRGGAYDRQRKKREREARQRDFKRKLNSQSWID